MSRLVKDGNRLRWEAHPKSENPGQCVHAWEPALPRGVAGKQRCANCPAEVRRDSGGELLEFTADREAEARAGDRGRDRKEVRR